MMDNFFFITANYFSELQSHFDGKAISFDSALEIRNKLPVTSMSGRGESDKEMREGSLILNKVNPSPLHQNPLKEQFVH